MYSPHLQLDLFTGGIGSAYEAEGADTVVMLGWGRCHILFPDYHLGAVMLAVESRFVAILMTLCAIGGAILGELAFHVFGAIAHLSVD